MIRIHLCIAIYPLKTCRYIILTSIYDFFSIDKPLSFTTLQIAIALHISTGETMQLYHIKSIYLRHIITSGVRYSIKLG